MRQIYPLFCFL